MNTAQFKITKKILSASEQVQHLKEKGITFRNLSLSDAVQYLRYHNNYFKLASYRKNFEKYQGGSMDGLYIQLDFSYLIDLSVIDMNLRYVLVQLALDIEHHTKLKLLRAIEDHQEDGYVICQDFINAQSEMQKRILLNEIQRNKNNIYCGNIIAKYEGNFPVWAFLEIIPFGRLLSFYKFCALRFSDKKMENEFYMLLACKDLRNAAAHNNCILNDLHTGNSRILPRRQIMNALSKIQGISKQVRNKRMSNDRIQEIITLLFMHRKLVKSKGIHNLAAKLLHDFSNRMMQHPVFYQHNDLITANFQFLKTIIDNWYKVI